MTFANHHFDSSFNAIACLTGLEMDAEVQGQQGRALGLFLERGIPNQGPLSYGSCHPAVRIQEFRINGSDSVLTIETQ